MQDHKVKRMEYLLELQDHCIAADQKFSGKNTRELNQLLTSAHRAYNLSGQENGKS